MKKVFSILVAIVVLTFLAIGAKDMLKTFFFDNPENENNGFFKDSIVQMADSFSTVTTLETSSAESTIVKAMEDLQPSVDLKAYNITEEDIGEIFSNVIHKYPHLFYISDNYSYSYDPASEKITSLNISYKEELTEITSKIQAFNAETDRILNELNISASMSDVEKALLVHDYLTMHYEYDTTLKFHSAEDLLIKKTGVCQAYALAYIHFLNKLNVESIYISSTPMNHAWNLVKIDEKWYHVDVTWDDPTSDLLGRSAHTFFLLSDAEMSVRTSEGKVHHGWQSEIKANDTYYDNFFWKDVQTGIFPLNGDWYYFTYTGSPVNQGVLNKYNFTAKTQTTVQTFSDRWNVWENVGTWAGFYSGIGIYNDSIYFNTADKIKMINPDGSGIKDVASPSTTTGYIYGFVLSGAKLTYAISTSPNNGTGSKHIIDIY